MSKAEASLAHLHKVFTKPEGKDSKLVQLEQHLSDNLADFLSRHVVASETSLEQIEQDFQRTAVPEHPQFVSEHAQHLLDKLVAHSVNTYSPRFIGHMTSALPYFHLSLAKLMVGLNQNLVKIETSKAFTPLERQVLGIMHRLIFKGDDAFYDTHLHSAHHALGAFCSGGTIANISALWVARNRLLCAQGTYRGVGRDGLMAGLKHMNLNGLAVISSKRGHYSLGKAVDLLGLGRESLVTLPCPEQRLQPQLVREQAKALAERGIRTMAIVGIAGTTETGHIDPLDELADVAEELGCHFHVDAAWGGATLFSTQHAGLLKGIERADSVTLDAHKQMYVPMGAGMVLFRDPEASNAVRHHAQYILREGSKDLGATSLEGSRNGMAMMLYAALHIFGREGYELLIDQSLAKARQFAAMLKAQPDFELTTEPTLCLLTYRLCPAPIQTLLAQSPQRAEELNPLLDELTVIVQKLQREAGHSFVSRTRLQVAPYPEQAINVFRVVLANPLTSEQDLMDILDEQLLIARKTDIWQQLMELA
ncbi:putative pyridoxal-dependent aspartate 1-decarboxylase [Aliiglaciecola sp. CAU 1673]|uniref:pyridoxal-dependent aspartate 1-decarboxylase PanP n=1 Tax=Aliiglaciecola sp. CAU 1673 TaxID=3032595 RepID=UPI0023DA5243|nr:putative pyridoxal-dependent aspartate 1-decarboxylase [Aliiglaciecola sp. CAU 1673]MDF2177803.1 putative pyridoxal-dependent aspartate 1-decarboxylase [Aliiglaciecola sp. CAU 1673]